MFVYWFLFEITINSFEAVIDIILLSSLFQAKDKRLHVNIPGLLTGTSYVAWLSFAEYHGLSYMFDYIVIGCIYLLYLFPFREGHWLNKILWVLLVNSVYGSIAYMVTRGLSILPGASLEMLYIHSGIRITAIFLVHILYLLFAWIVIKSQRRKHDKPPLNLFGLSVMCVLCLFSICVLVLIEYIQVIYKNDDLLLLCSIVSFTTLLVNISVIFLIDRMTSQSHEMSQLKAEAYLSNIQLRHHSEMGNLYDEIRLWRHDFHNHLNVIKGLAETDNLDEVIKYTSTWLNDFNKFDMHVNTGNIAIDSLLNNKFAYARNNRIKIEQQLNLPDKLPILDTQICVLLGNLIDNSIEACLKMNSGDRFINFSILPTPVHLKISIDNSTESEEQHPKSANYTTKENPELHGLGLRSIDNIVESIDGYSIRENTNGVYKTTIQLPLRPFINSDSVPMEHHFGSKG